MAKVKDGYFVGGFSNEYILLAGGGEKELSELASSDHNHDTRYVKGVSTSGTTLTYIIGTTSYALSIPTGPQGAQGIQGLQGLQGIQGLVGIQGPLGLQGAQGAKGATGNTGNTGSTGAQGAIGTQGAQGLKGTNGTNGSQGAVGAQGAAGTAGAKGAQGAAGTAGAAGAKGAQGAVGAQGAKGAQGAVGAQGAKGATGNTGNTGSTGAQGAAGTAGAAGAKGVQGAAGAKGAQGATGNTGNTGSTGAQGAAGAKGAQGAAGTAGAAGAKGAQGAAGTAGAAGAKGAQGAAGTAGAAGAKGAQGAAGTAGAAGAKGAQGAAGAKGAQGAAGAKGAQGAIASTAFTALTFSNPTLSMTIGGVGKSVSLATITAASAAKLGTTENKTIWGQTYWSGGLPQNVAGHLYLNNANYVYGKDSASSNRILIGIDGGNELLVGYGSFGTTAVPKTIPTYLYSGSHMRFFTSPGGTSVAQRAIIMSNGYIGANIGSPNGYFHALNAIVGNQGGPATTSTFLYLRRDQSTGTTSYSCDHRIYAYRPKGGNTAYTDDIWLRLVTHKGITNGVITWTSYLDPTNTCLFSSSTAATVQGYTTLQIGAGTGGTAANTKCGRILLYGLHNGSTAATRYVMIRPNNFLANRTYTIPYKTSDQTFAMLSDIPSISGLIKGITVTYTTAQRYIIGHSATTGNTITTFSTGGPYMSGSYIYYNSDRRLKEGITTFPKRKLENILYGFSAKEYSFKQSDKRSIGYIAQEVNEVEPMFVNMDENTGYLSLNYQSILVAKVQALTYEVKMLKERMKKIEDLMLEKHGIDVL